MKSIKKIASAIKKKLQNYEYHIIIHNNNHSFLFEDKSSLKSFHILKNPIFYWLADPFLVEKDNNIYVFAEAANKITRKGKIVFSLLNNKKMTWKECIKAKSHFSFPNVENNGTYFTIIPETSDKKIISSYTSNDFKQWKLANVFIKNTSCVDTVIFDEQHLLTYILDGNNNYLALINLKSGLIIDKILDEKRVLRPAGKIFDNDGVKLLPTQDCSHIYGGGIIFNHILFINNKLVINKISEIDAKDAEKYIKTKYKIIGIHTYNKIKNIEISDIVQYKISFLGILGKIYYFCKTRFLKTSAKQ